MVVVEKPKMDRKQSEETVMMESVKRPAASKETEHLQLLEKALGEIPVESKRPYLQAMEKASDLVARETDPLNLLRCYNYDVTKTAQAIIAYWERRSCIFRDKGHLLLSLTETESALNAECQKMLEEGTVLQLPSDTMGRPVVFCDQTRLNQETAMVETCVSCCFYLLHRSLQDCKTPFEGVVLVLKSGLAPAFSVKLLTDFEVPFRLHACHVVISCEVLNKSVREAHLKDLSNDDTSKVHLHLLNDATMEAPPTLLDFGLHVASLPLSLGGTWIATDTMAAKRCDSRKQGTALRNVDCAYLAEIEEAIARMGVDAKSSYLEAIEKAPELVQKESDPMNYLRRYGFDAAVAARHLVSYWRKRVQVYGKRALTPMSQTGEGTLGRADFSSLSSGVLLNLPSDTAGNPVVFYDISKAVDIPRDALLRVVFYMLSVAAEAACRDLAKGLILLLPMDCDPGLTCSKYNFDDILEVIPVRIEAAHVITCQPHSRSSDQLSAAAQSAFATIPPRRLVVHTAFSRSEAIRKLESHGLSQLGLPKSIGGQWGVERLVEWMELRTRFEWNLPPAASHKGVDKVFDFSGLKQPSKLSEEDRIERSRRMNVLHSRRKRERERIEIEVLHEHCDELRAKREYLVREGERLKRLLEAASDAVAVSERGGGRASSLGSAIQPLQRQPVYGMPARYASTSLMESQRQRISSYPQPVHAQPYLYASGMQGGPMPQPVMSGFQVFPDQDTWARSIPMQHQPQPLMSFASVQPQPEMPSLPFASPSQPPAFAAQPWQPQPHQLYAMAASQPQQYQLVPVQSYGIGPPAAPIVFQQGAGGDHAYPDVTGSGGGSPAVYRLVGGGGGGHPHRQRRPN